MPKQSENKKQKSRMASFGMPFLTRSSLMSLVCRLSLSHRHYIVQRNGSTSSSNDDWNGNVMMRVSWCCYSHLVCRLLDITSLKSIYFFFFSFFFSFFLSCPSDLRKVIFVDELERATTKKREKNVGEKKRKFNGTPIRRFLLSFERIFSSFFSY